VRGFKKCCISKARVETDYMLWNNIEQDGIVRSVKKMKALTVTMETVTLIDRSR
jgi:hypothetical protein